MKVSELIEKLEYLKEKHGDGKVYCFDENGYIQEVTDVYPLVKRIGEKNSGVIIE